MEFTAIGLIKLPRTGGEKRKQIKDEAAILFSSTHYQRRQRRAGSRMQKGLECRLILNPGQTKLNIGLVMHSVFPNRSGRLLEDLMRLKVLQTSEEVLPL